MDKERDISWPCRTLPHGKDHIGYNHRIEIENIDSSIDLTKLDQMFSEAFGEVYTNKIWHDVQRIKDTGSQFVCAPVSRGKGYVIFKTREALDKALAAGSLNDILIVPQPQISTLFLQNFNPVWTDVKVKKLFSKYGKIKSITLTKEECPKTGNEIAYAFILYGKGDDQSYSVNCALQALVELHGKHMDGFTLDLVLHEKKLDAAYLFNLHGDEEKCYHDKKSIM